MREHSVKSNTGSKLKQLHDQFRQWELSEIQKLRPEAPFEFPMWEVYVKTLVEFLSQKSGESWTKEETALIRSIISSDWKTVALLRDLPRDTLASIVCLPYPDRVVRMYMLQYAKMQAWMGWAQEIGEYFFENDVDNVLRCEALQLLASLKWSRTDQSAKTLWQSEDPADRMVALQCFANAQSGLLAQFLLLAKEDSDKSVRLYAASLEAQMIEPEQPGS
jgi:hypothetical protein